MSLTQCKLCVADARPPVRIHRVYTIYVHCVPLALRPTKPPRPIQCGADMQLHAIPRPAGQASQVLANTMQAEYGWLALVTARPLGVCRVCTLLTCIPSHIYAHMATQARLGPQVMAQRTALL